MRGGGWKQPVTGKMRNDDRKPCVLHVSIPWSSFSTGILQYREANIHSVKKSTPQIIFHTQFIQILYCMQTSINSPGEIKVFLEIL